MKLACLAAALALASVAHVAHVAHAQGGQSPAREALLARLLAVMPPQNVSIEQLAVTVRNGASGAEARAAAVNPGREQDVAVVYQSYAICVATGIEPLVPALTMRIVDSALSDEEIQSQIDFFSGPNHARFVDILARRRGGEELNADDQAFYESVHRDSAAMKFAEAARQAFAGFPQSAEGRRILDDCRTRRRDDFARYDLREP
ncbi:MAG: hypothetical protein ABL932_03810 [Terricaulis sp.]